MFRSLISILGLENQRTAVAYKVSQDTLQVRISKHGEQSQGGALQRRTAPRAASAKDWQLNTTIRIIETKLRGRVWLDDEAGQCRFTVKITSPSDDPEVQISSPQLGNSGGDLDLGQIILELQDSRGPSKTQRNLGRNFDFGGQILIESNNDSSSMREYQEDTQGVSHLQSSMVNTFRNASDDVVRLENITIRSQR